MIRVSVVEVWGGGGRDAKLFKCNIIIIILIVCSGMQDVSMKLLLCCLLNRNFTCP